MEACLRCGTALQPADAHCQACGAPRASTGYAMQVPPELRGQGAPSGGVHPTQPMQAHPGVGGHAPGAPHGAGSGPTGTVPFESQAPGRHPPPTPGQQSQSPMQQPPMQQPPMQQPPVQQPPMQQRPAGAHALTAVANEAFTLVRTFEVAFAKPFPGWRAELREPVGPSTGGGRQSLQAISIVDGQGNRLAVGSVDSAKQVATLRSYEMVAAMHEARFDGDPFLVRQPDYNKFIEGVTNLFSSSSIAVKLETVAPTPKRSVAPPPRGNTILILLVVATLFAILVAVYVALT